MATIRGFAERFANIDFKGVAMDSFMETNEEVIEKNLEQLKEGKDKKGMNLRKYAWDWYAVMKHNLNPAPGLGNPDLKLTGAYWRGFIIKQMGETQYEITSIDSKTGKLDDMYGKQQYGLNDEKRPKYINEDYLPVLTKNIREKVYQ